MELELDHGSTKAWSDCMLEVMESITNVRIQKAQYLPDVSSPCE